MTKDEAKKVIECAVRNGEACRTCSVENACDKMLITCEKYIHSAAKELYSGNETNEVVELAKNFIIERIKAGGNVGAIEVDGAFKLAEYFLKKASEINE